jgi:hypothetical protein
VEGFAVLDDRHDGENQGQTTFFRNSGRGVKEKRGLSLIFIFA